MEGIFRTRTRCAVAAAVIAVLASSSGGAQPLSGNGYLFHAPKGSVTLRAGYAGAAAGSDVFDFVTNELTLNRKDFGAVSAGADLAIRVLKRWDLVLGYDAAGMRKKSEFREWEDDSGNPIEQSTAFSRQGWTLSARYYVLPDGRSLGRFAWVPARYVPWVSAGLGRTNYSFSQDGDFIDFEQGNNVFRDSFKSSQWTSTWQLAGGVDWSLNKRFALTTQARYLFGKAELQYDYSGFDPIDLSGIGASAGLSIRF